MKLLFLLVGQIAIVAFAFSLYGVVLVLDGICWALDTPEYTG